MTDLKVWTEMVERIRDRCDILIHLGVAAMQIEDRVELLRCCGPIWRPSSSATTISPRAGDP
jgi:hypothetical protein